MKAGYDYVIIGSGFGGAAAACRIAHAQRAAGRRASVCVLERGKRYGLGGFPRDFGRTRDWLWCEGGRNGWTGLFDYRAFDNIGVITGTGVGGTSLVYLDVQLEAFASTFDAVGPDGRRRWPGEVDWAAEMPRYYKRLTDMLRPTPIPDAPLKTHALEAAAGAAGDAHRFRRLPLAIYWGREGSERGIRNADPYGRGGPPQYGCQYCGECFIGCNIHAKNTLDLNYLWLAERAGAEVYSLRNVLHIEKNAASHALHPHGYTVEYEDLRWGARAARVSAGRLILAAGSLGSTELLLRAKHGYRRGRRRVVAPTLPNLSERLGTGFSGNGDFGALATKTNRDTAPMTGPTITAVLDYSDAFGGNGFLVEDGGVPDVLRAQLRRLPGGLAYWRRMVRAVKDLVGRDADRKLVEGLFDWLDFQTVRDALPLLIMGHDAANGVMSVDPAGVLVIEWPHADSLAYFRTVEAHARYLSEAPSPGLAGNMLLPLTWSLKKQLITFHPLGGCPMGSDAGEGVVDHAGAVFHYPNLYVLDGSIVPSAIGPNPSKTIGALAERGAAHLIARDPDLGPAPGVLHTV